jgi:hypothetical protein
MALLNTWASQQDQATLSPLDRLLNNYIQKGDAPLAYLMRGDAQGLLKDLNTPKPVNMTQDMANAALNLNPVMGLIGATAYHGSPYLFDKFDPKKIGTGQGQQSYGYGTYFSENPKVADYYKYQLKPTEEFLQKVNKGEYNDLQKLVTEGNMYKVDIPDEYIPKMLDFEKPLYKQSNEVKQLAFEYKPGLEERLKFLGGDGIFDLTGSDLFGVMQRYSPNSSKINTQNITSKEISDKMLSKGIMGSKYYDASSKDALANKAYNYVIFDPSNVKILDINDKGLLK